MNKTLEEARLDREVLWYAALRIEGAARNSDSSHITTDDYELRAAHFIGIYDFVEYALATNVVPITKSVVDRWRTKYDLTKISRMYAGCLPSYIGALDHLPLEYNYTDHINLFRSSWKLVGCQYDYLTMCICSTQFLTLGTMSPEAALYVDLFNSFVDSIRAQAKVTQFSTTIAERRRQAKLRHSEYSSYADSLHAAVANLIVIRLDLYYIKEFAHLVDFSQAKRDIDRLFANQHHNRLFRALVGHIVKIEYGIEKRFHFHVLLFFDGAKRDPRKHINLAKEIGEYWCEMITKGKGGYWNCNAKIDEFLKMGTCGIGPIHASDTLLRNNLKNLVIRYLCKMEQFVRPVLSQKAKLLTRGNRPHPARHTKPRRKARI